MAGNRVTFSPYGMQSTVLMMPILPLWNWIMSTQTTQTAQTSANAIKGVEAPRRQPVRDDSTPVVSQPAPSNKFSESELSWLWSDMAVSPESLDKIASGKMKSNAFVTPDVRASLNEWGVLNSYESTLWADRATLIELLGIVKAESVDVPVMDENGEPVTNPVVDKDGNPIIDENGNPVTIPATTKEAPASLFSHTVGKGEKQNFMTTKNSTNRPLVKDNLALCKRRALSREVNFNGEGLIFDSVGNAGSAQHRVIGYYLAMLSDQTLPAIPIPVRYNVPAIFADTIDTGAKRTDAQINLRHLDVLEEETLVDKSGNPFGSNVKLVRGQMGGDLGSVLRLVNMRLLGKNVNASKKPEHGGQFLYGMFADKSLDRMVNEVFLHDSVHGTGSASDKYGIAKTLGRGNVCAAIVLSELSDYDNPAIVDGKQLVIPEPTQELFLLDVDSWKERLGELSLQIMQGEGDWWKIFSQIFQANKVSRQATQDKFASICYLVSEMSGEESITIDENDNEIVTPRLLDWSSKGSTSTAIPKAKSITASCFPHFGGADLGPWKAPTAE